MFPPVTKAIEKRAAAAQFTFATNATRPRVDRRGVLKVNRLNDRGYARRRSHLEARMAATGEAAVCRAYTDRIRVAVDDLAFARVCSWRCRQTRIVAACRRWRRLAALSIGDDIRNSSTPRFASVAVAFERQIAHATKCAPPNIDAVRIAVAWSTPRMGAAKMAPACHILRLFKTSLNVIDTRRQRRRSPSHLPPRIVDPRKQPPHRSSRYSST